MRTDVLERVDDDVIRGALKAAWHVVGVEPAQDKLSLHRALRRLFGVSVPTRAVCEGHSAPMDAVWDSYSAAAPIVVWHAARGFGGKTRALSALALYEAMVHGCAVNVLGGSAEQSERVVEYMDHDVGRESFPQGLLTEHGQGARRASVTKARISLANGGSVLALAASGKSVRGSHPVRLRVDEADEMDLRIYDAAMGQTMARDDLPAQTTISSTWHHADGTFTEVLRRAREKGHKVHAWCWRECLEENGGWLAMAEVERKRAEVPAAMFAAEYDLHEPAPTSRAIMPDKVEAMFQRELGEYAGENGEYVEIEPPVDGARYATGADWAKERDWTICATIRADVQPARVVAFERVGRKPWPLMTARFDYQVNRYKSLAHHDKTGIGGGAEDMLTVAATGVTLVGRVRSGILGAYIAAVESGDIVSPMIDHAYTEHRYASLDDVYGSGHLPDTICALALAWHGAKQQPFGIVDWETETA